MVQQHFLLLTCFAAASLVEGFGVLSYHRRYATFHRPSLKSASDDDAMTSETNPFIRIGGDKSQGGKYCTRMTEWKGLSMENSA
jgi:hypothetical protein